MSKAELLLELGTLSHEDLDEVAERLDQLRGRDVTEEERTLVRSRLAEYRKDPADLIDLDTAVREILNSQK